MSNYRVPLVLLLVAFVNFSEASENQASSNLRRLVQGNGQIECTPPCRSPNFGNVEILDLWVQHENIFWRCQKPKMIALTFDDGPDYNTVKFVEKLDSLGVPGTFFINANRIDSTTGKLLTQMESHNHLIAHHTFNHASMKDAEMNQNEAVTAAGGVEEFLTAEIDEATRVAGQYLQHGLRPYLRPPFADMDKYMADQLQNRGLYVVQFSIDTKDYAKNSKSFMENAFLNVIENPGEEPNSNSNSHISLQHDIHENSLPILEPIVKGLKNAGFEFVTIDECLGYPEGDATPERFNVTLPMNRLDWNCLGDPCADEEQCRSEHRYCGVGQEFCNDLSIWKKKCLYPEENTTSSTSNRFVNTNFLALSAMCACFMKNPF